MESPTEGLSAPASLKSTILTRYADRKRYRAGRLPVTLALARTPTASQVTRSVAAQVRPRILVSTRPEWSHSYGGSRRDGQSDAERACGGIIRPSGRISPR